MVLCLLIFKKYPGGCFDGANTEFVGTCG